MQSKMSQKNNRKKKIEKKKIRAIFYI